MTDKDTARGHQARAAARAVAAQRRAEKAIATLRAITADGYPITLTEEDANALHLFAWSHHTDHGQTVTYSTAVQ